MVEEEANCKGQRQPVSQLQPDRGGIHCGVVRNATTVSGVSQRPLTVSRPSWSSGSSARKVHLWLNGTGGPCSIESRWSWRTRRNNPTWTGDRCHLPVPRSPKLANKVRKVSTVAPAAVDVISTASGHFNKKKACTRHIPPRKPCATPVCNLATPNAHQSPIISSSYRVTMDGAELLHFIIL